MSVNPRPNNFADLMSTAKQNANEAKREENQDLYEPNKLRQTDPKEVRGVSECLAKCEEEDGKKIEEERVNKEKLLQLRDQDRKAANRVRKMQSEFQPDEDDYGYTSTNADMMHKKVMEDTSLGSKQSMQSPTGNSSFKCREVKEGAVGSEQNRPSSSGFRNNLGAGDNSFSAKPSFAVSQLVESEHPGNITCLKFSPNGLYLATASVGRQIRIWDTAEFKYRRGLTGHSKGCSEVAWSSDSRLLVSASDDQQLKVWDVDTVLCPYVYFSAITIAGSCIYTLIGHGHHVFSCDFNFDSSLIVSGAYDGRIGLWETEKGICTKVFVGHSQGVTSVRFDPDGKLVVSSSFDTTCRIWDAETGNCLKYLIAKSAVSFAAFPPNDNGCVIFASLDSIIRVWKYDDGNTSVGSAPVSAGILKRFTGRVNKEYCITLNLMTSGDDTWVVCGSEDDGSIFIWDYKTGELLQKLTDGNAGEVIPVACHPTENIIVSACMNDHAFRVWKA
ncbi:WD repeat-containing protein 5 [Orchesella cincta]|uniref:WD repeat-containing protein 5 n=1 Tax=Orchesella cincta TaxID=48709 RepID=A0A1D2NFZ9_ORCCI|nr:WD repeat-containing protein 5 [Orchesella cincta]